ncbi:hypothetical protein MKY41_10445 [Sporosarcina sp. FSL W7-1349]|uniref:hypothetical protein n=1 Tax=Sporosarcina sp. FSL W7-1349 TaxID=2921561 RepID=UPI0030F7AACF
MRGAKRQGILRIIDGTYVKLPDIGSLLRNCKRRRRKSRGRQKVPERIPIEIRFGEDVAIVDPIAKEHFLKKR